METKWPGIETLEVPWPATIPFGIDVTPEGVEEVWNTFVKPVQDADEPQSVEMRVLMAILRSVYEGMVVDLNEED